MPQTTSKPSLFYQQVGDSGPRVLLIMGLGMGGAAWLPQIEGLRRRAQIAHFDNRGIGQSESGRGGLSMQDMAGDASRVLNALGWAEDVHLVGVSMGGMIAQELALQEPERIASLTLVATHAGGPLRLPPARGAQLFAQTFVGPTAQRLDRLARLLYTDEFLRQSKNQLAERMRQAGPPASRSSVAKQLIAVIRHDTRARLAKLRAPTLVIKPELDLLIHPRASDELAKRIPKAQLISLANAGHGVTFECAQRINELIWRHVSATETPTTESAT